ncbi:hypothetical protein L798_07314 [Zootermopsis nevadensis]|uniref:Uncharacterized protein n=1 Tax=Zootermopsis nevadensis TaxID=136037 RepID=A0A067RHZ5_ZOONE|nr:hypothetical protein L798_07314 [Zootermopsis nevadensis]
MEVRSFTSIYPVYLEVSPCATLGHEGNDQEVDCVTATATAFVHRAVKKVSLMMFFTTAR